MDRRVLKVMYLLLNNKKLVQTNEPAFFNEVVATNYFSDKKSLILSLCTIASLKV